MSKRWPLVPLAEVLTQDRDYIDHPEPKLYPKLSVKLYGKGVVLDAPADGATLRMQRHQLAKAGQVILSEIWGKKGAVGVVPPEGDGALCTSHFFLFDINCDRVEPGYLRLLFSSNQLEEQLGSEARGTTGYAAVRPEHFLAAKVPFPHIPEQRRIVARIEKLAMRIEEATRLRNQIVAECEAMCRGMITAGTGIPLVPVGDVARQRQPDVTVNPDESYDFAGVYCFGRGVFRGPRRAGSEFSYRRLTRLRTGDFVYPKLMAWEGALAVVPPKFDGLVVSPEFPVFEIDERLILPEVLDVYFRTPSVWPLVSGASIGTNVRRRRLNPKQFLAFKIPLPSMPAQRQIRKVKSLVDAILAAKNESTPELGALLPSLLSKAFAGEL